ncbi:MAG: HlyD family secretion protein [Burkholderiaceae bacterium]
MNDATPPNPTPNPTPPQPAKRGFWPLPGKHPAAVALALVAGTSALLAVLYAWQLPPFDKGEQVTDNAYVRGRTTVIAPQVSGYVVGVDVKDYASVEAGHVLVRIDDRQYHARVDQATAALETQRAALANLQQAHAAKVAALQGQAAAVLSAQAQLLRARTDLARVDDLVRDGSVSQREQDQLKAALAQAEAQLLQAQAAQEIARQDIRTVDVNREGVKAQIDAASAQLRSAMIDLENTVVHAPEKGQLGEIGVRLGQYVTNGTQLLPIVPADRWVIANFKETQVAGMRSGMPAWISVDALGGRRYKGHIGEVAPATGSEFSVVKPDNGTGNFVKIPQRVGIRILVDADQPGLQDLLPGMSVEAHVNTRGGQVAGKS